MLATIIGYVVLFWVTLSLVFPPFFLIFFILILLFPQEIFNLKWLFVYIIITGIILFFWNYELRKIPGEQLEDLDSLDYALAHIFTFLLNLSIIIGAIVRFIQLAIPLCKKYRRIKSIKKNRISKRS
ncbi:MAG: hypothetical protein ACRC1Z_25165 [Waterburya sp.]